VAAQHDDTRLVGLRHGLAQGALEVRDVVENAAEGDQIEAGIGEGECAGIPGEPLGVGLAATADVTTASFGLGTSA
jgi:hypothetical protein